MKFTFEYIENQYEQILGYGYTLVSCQQAVSKLRTTPPVQQRATGEEKTLVNRVDVDISVKKALRLGLMFEKLNVPATFFFRLHANEYNLLSFENVQIVRELAAMGFEIGYHSEVIDCSTIWGVDAQEVLEMDLQILELACGKIISGVSSHGGLTGLNNQDHFRPYAVANPAIEYEAYDPVLFDAGVYVSDSEWTNWKSYRNGIRVADDFSNPADYASRGTPLIYMLIHPETYFDRHIYET